MVATHANEYPRLTKMNMSEQLPAHTMVLLPSDREVVGEARADYMGHHRFYWTCPRRTWLDAKCPVYIDFGRDVPYRLPTYDETSQMCVSSVA